MSVSSSPFAYLALQQAAYRHLASWKRFPWLRRSCPLSSRPPATKAGQLGRIALATLKGIGLLHLLFFGFVAFTLCLWKFSDPSATSLMAYRRLTQGTTIKPVRFIPYGDISVGTRNAFIQLEDHQFWEHFGVDPEAIKDALAINRRIGRTVYGGSTITQQLARTLFLTPDRNLVRKYLEAGIALQLEIILGKRRIMELYLNYIEFGPGVFGLGAAARYHYKTSFYNLGYEQRLRLAAIITSPLRYNVNTLWNNAGMVARYRALLPKTEK